MSVVHGIFNYISDGSKFNVSRSYGWCFNCKDIVAIENLVSGKTSDVEIMNFI